MGTLTNIRERMDGLDDRLYRVGQMAGEKRKIKDPRRAKLIEEVTLTEAQKGEIDRFYLEHYGEKIPYDWHRLYQSFTGTFQVGYFPEFLFGPRLVPDWNPKEYRIFGDKNLLSVLAGGIPGLRTAKVYGSCTNGIYRNGQGEIVSFGELKRQLAEDIADRKVVIKPTTDSSSGRDIRIAAFEGGIEKETRQPLDRFLEETLKGYKGSWNIQEFIRNPKELTEIYSGSVNTFRTVTYLWNDAFHPAPLVLRIGRGGHHVDNVHSDGIFVGCSHDGQLRDCAFNQLGERFEKHPDTGTVFKGYRIPGVVKVLECAKRMHERLPQMRIVFWDFTLDESGEVVLVEINVNSLGCWLPQISNGEPLFGNNTAAILKSLRR